MSTADSVEPSFAKGSPEHFATWGWLMLRGAAAAVRNNRDDRAAEMLDAAAAAGARVASSRRSVVTSAPATVGTFGPATVAMKRAETAIVTGETGRALQLAAEGPDSERPTSNNRDRHLLDVAFEQADNRLYAEATAILERVRRDAPVWLRHQRYAREIVGSVVASRRRALGEELSDLVAAVGLEL